MRRFLAVLPLLAAVAPAAAQSVPGTTDHQVPHPSYNVTATGRTMPPTSGREAPGTARPSAESDMLKAQRATEERNKAWDAKMRRTMGTICNGC